MSPEDVVESPPLHGTPLPGRPDHSAHRGSDHLLRGHLRHHPHPRPHGGPHLYPYTGQCPVPGGRHDDRPHLHHSKFPFAFCVRDYLDSMRKMRTEPADKFIVAHYGIYDEILPLVDMEARFFAERMVDLLDLVDGPTTPAKMAADICRTYHIDAGDLRNLSYFATLQPVHINYLRGLGYLEAH